MSGKSNDSMFPDRQMGINKPTAQGARYTADGLQDNRTVRIYALNRMP
jgi:hypothetical protein